MKFDITKELGIETSAQALKVYSEGFQEALELKNIAIFLDTNVLISYYGMASSEKKKLIAFLKKNKKNIYLTHQVQVEFGRNRVKNIESDLFTPLRKIPDDLDSAISDTKNKFKQFLSSSKKILMADYPQEWNKLKEVEEELSEILNIDDLKSDLREKIDSTTSDLKDIKVVDELLNTCLLLGKTPKLDEKEISNIEGLFDRLWDNYDKANSSNKKYCVFPRAGAYFVHFITQRILAPDNHHSNLLF
ncbi:PIN-like domain-containing protein [Vibrio aestuarianus]|uniref:PIN-like domain-containing protein n=2 Tax=Vibrio aestuarianus TaxID=28171 RepID=UPI00237C6E3F|nr:PIN-like domain-containing protein [Vibrio aestuarianus]MDE1229192.1 PIN-like domain-containing protein [Vibrio aestuarianus]WDS56315.1 PIN-like domain-containing protein [Vibrio aestuarianus]WDS59680.1 PIN-like domain-containing protein [Vibrio aestuarianus]